MLQLLKQNKGLIMAVVVTAFALYFSLSSLFQPIDSTNFQGMLKATKAQTDELKKSEPIETLNQFGQTSVLSEKIAR